VDLAASIQRPPVEAPEPIRILNLSLAGACIESTAPFGKGARVMLEIVAPTLWDPLVLRGRVVWTSDSGGPSPRAGLHFEHQEAGHAFALYELLSAQGYDM
jgi:PilZ domain-containing protein